MNENWITKFATDNYPAVYPPIRIYADCYTEVLQKDSMSGMYPEFGWLCEYDLIDYKGTILVPWGFGKPQAGFTYHDTKKDALNFIKENSKKFMVLADKYPEYFI